MAYQKRLIQAVAGAGKTTYIVNQLQIESRALIVTYTNENYESLVKRIMDKFGGIMPEHIQVMTFYRFLYRFCYSPILADKYRAVGIDFDNVHIGRGAKMSMSEYYMTKSKRLFASRLSLLLIHEEAIGAIKDRISRFYDMFIVDEVQDLDSYDFDFMISLLDAKVNILLVGDFYQHIFSTSRSGNKNISLYKDYQKYIDKFKAIEVDDELLEKSYRCSPEVCDFIRDKLGINIYSHKKSGESVLKYIDDDDTLKEIWRDSSIMKLHHSESSKYGNAHSNWGKSKGCQYEKTCVLLTANIDKMIHARDFSKLSAGTLKSFYVALTRSSGDVYLVSGKKIIELMSES